MKKAKTMKLLLLSFFMLAMSMATYAADNAATTGFSHEEFSFAGTALNYRKGTVKTTVEKPALVIYLHGGSSKGSDNETQMGEAGIDSIYNYLVSHQMDAVMLVPQCPADKSWGGGMNAVLAALVRQYVNSGVVDADKVYLFGGSMGGTGTWGMVSAYPDMFAAAMPVAGNPSKCVAENVAHTPVYTVMGTADKIMNMETVQAFTTRLTACGGEWEYDIKEGWTHETTCIQSYTEARLAWVFGKIRDSGQTYITSNTEQEEHPTTHIYDINGKEVGRYYRNGVTIITRRYANGTTKTIKKVVRQ